MKKEKVSSALALFALFIMLIGATYGYFVNQTEEGKQTDVIINAYTVDVFTFEVGSNLSLNLNQDNFASGKGNQTSETNAKAILKANNKTNTVTKNYYMYLNISTNTFSYTSTNNTPEMILTITNSAGTELTSVTGLTHVTTTDAKGNQISGFDITNKSGLITLINNRTITTTSNLTEEWTLKVTFVNHNFDQSKNAGNSFDAQVLITSESYEDYTPATINTLTTSKSGNNLSVTLTMDEGTSDIDKYYYAIKEKSGVAMNNTNSKVLRLSKLASSDITTYLESSSPTYTFTNVDNNKEYVVSTYAVDKKKIKTNFYEYNLSTNSYVTPSVSDVSVNITGKNVKVTADASNGTNNISKYYYSLDGGKTFIESTDDEYTFTNVGGGYYKVIIKVSDTTGKYSNTFVKSFKVIPSMTFAQYIKSLYTTQGTNGLYHHDSNLANGAGDDSYRFAGADPDNYVCFGSDAAICPTDNLYRIIGVFNDQVKLIKGDFANSNLLGTDGNYNSSTISASSVSSYKGYLTSINEYSWGAMENNRWERSVLNSTNLNTNFITNIGSTWAEKIATTTWIVGGYSETYTMDSLIKDIYGKEITNPASTTTVSKKIGLMYVSDYGYAATPTYWSTASSSFSSSNNANWMYMGIGEWTITPRAAGTNGYSFSVGGNIGFTDTIFANAVRPCFYLDADITLAQGEQEKKILRTGYLRNSNFYEIYMLCEVIVRRNLWKK